MTQKTEGDLDRLGRGRGIDRAALLGLLGDPAARQDLDRLAKTRVILDSGGGLPEVPSGMEMGVSWEELAQHAEGALADEGRRREVERFLNQHFPEALQGGPGRADAGTAAGMGETVADAAPAPRGEAGE
jgi:hypothetical protein